MTEQFFERPIQNSSYAYQAQHWWHHQYLGIHPFFCLVEAVVFVIWLTEAAPKLGERGTDFIVGISGGE